MTTARRSVSGEAEAGKAGEGGGAGWWGILIVL